MPPKHFRKHSSPSECVLPPFSSEFSANLAENSRENGGKTHKDPRQSLGACIMRNKHLRSSVHSEPLSDGLLLEVRLGLIVERPFRGSSFGQKMEKNAE